MNAFVRFYGTCCTKTVAKETRAIGRSLAARSSELSKSLTLGEPFLILHGPGGGDLDDYNGSNLTDPYNASTGAGQAHHLNSVDITNLDVIGYDLAAAVVPELATLALLGLGLAGLGFSLRKP